MAKPSRKTERIEIRVTPAQKRALLRAARRSGRTLSQHIVAAASHDSAETPRPVIALSPADTRTIIAALRPGRDVEEIFIPGA